MAVTRLGLCIVYQAYGTPNSSFSPANCPQCIVSSLPVVQALIHKALMSQVFDTRSQSWIPTKRDLKHLSSLSSLSDSLIGCIEFSILDLSNIFSSSPFRALVKNRCPVLYPDEDQRLLFVSFFFCLCVKRLMVRFVLQGFEGFCLCNICTSPPTEH